MRQMRGMVSETMEMEKRRRRRRWAHLMVDHDTSYVASYVCEND